MAGSRKSIFSVLMIVAILVAIAAVMLGGVTTGNGGGSPRLIPATLAPEIQPPTTGYNLWVFALPDRK